MTIRKKGDHLVATGLAKTIADIAEDVQAIVGDNPDGQRMLKALSECSRMISGGTFDAVIDRGKPVLTDDTHSVTFGAVSLKLKLEMKSLARALRLYHAPTGATAGERQASFALGRGAVAQSKQAVWLALGDFFREAIDTTVEHRISTVTRGEVAALRATLTRMHDAIWNCIEPL